MNNFSHSQPLPNHDFRRNYLDQTFLNRAFLKLSYISIFLMLFYFAAGASADTTQAKDVELNWIAIEEQSLDKYFYLEATIEAVNQSQLTAETSGKVKRVLVDVNDYVEAGQVIIELRDTQQRARLSQAQANLQQVKASFNVASTQLTRAKTLFDQGNLSQGDLDQVIAKEKSASAGKRAAEAAVKSAQENLNYTLIKAPYSGIVSKRLVETGETVFPGKPLINGLSLSQLRAEASIPQRFAHTINRKQDFKIQVGNQLIDPTKVTLFPFADKNTHSIKVRVEFQRGNDDQTLLPGTWVKLGIPVEIQKQINVPASSVISNGAINTVVVKVGETNILRHVRVGQLYNDSYEVLSGLKVGEQILENPQSWLLAQEAN